MSGAAEVERGTSAMEEAARVLLEIHCSREDRRIRTAYKDVLTDAVIVFSMANGHHATAELDFSISMPSVHGDPYAIALAETRLAPRGRTIPSAPFSRTTPEECPSNCSSSTGRSRAVSRGPTCSSDG